jgi:hypothetical protein
LDPEKSSSKKQRARNEEQQQQQRSRSARRCTSEQYREWNEFIERQELLLKAKEAKAARVIAVQERRQKMASPEVSAACGSSTAAKAALD